MDYVTQVGDPDGVLSSQFCPDPAMIVMATWGIKQLLEDLSLSIPFSLSLGFSNKK